MNRKQHDGLPEQGRRIGAGWRPGHDPLAAASEGGLGPARRRRASREPHAWVAALLAVPAVAALSPACGDDETTTTVEVPPTTTWSTTSSTGGHTGSSSGSGGASTGTGTGTVEPYRHSIAIDGVNDFVVADERFDTTTGSPFFGYYAWDETFLYVGVEGPDIASGEGTKWVLLYVGGTPGTTTGVTYGLGTVDLEPTLPFFARYHVQWCANNTTTVASEWTGSSWSPLAWDFTGDVYQSGPYLELRIPWSDIGSPTTLDVHLSLVNEAAAGEWTFAGVPSTSFVDAADPDYSAYYSFDLGSASMPASYPPQ